MVWFAIKTAQGIVQVLAFACAWPHTCGRARRHLALPGTGLCVRVASHTQPDTRPGVEAWWRDGIALWGKTVTICR